MLQGAASTGVVGRMFQPSDLERKKYSRLKNAAKN
jgi:hypothetical protein